MKRHAALIAAIFLTACSANDSSLENQTASSQSKLLGRTDKNAAVSYQAVVQEMYISYFGRPADPTGLANFENALASVAAPTDIQSLSTAYGSSTAIQSLINSFGNSAESSALYGSSTTTAFVTAVFQNVLNRAPQSSGLTFWVNAIDSGSLSQGNAALSIMAGALANTTAQGVLDTILINNRLSVANYFTAQVSTQNAVSSYSGAAAATSARTMLSAVTATTNTSTIDASVNAVVSALTTPIDLTKLPLGDTMTTTTTPAVGYLYECSVQSGGGGASIKGPWFNSDGTTWNSANKVSVKGSVSWSASFLSSLVGSIFNINSNDLPNHNTGTFPIASTDPAYAYDRNPNKIAAQTIAWGLPGNPQVANQPTCVGGVVGILLTGAKLFNAVDGENRDANAWEVQDSCQGHPDVSSTYHYHSVSTCVPQKDTVGQHSPLVGYAADGFGIYGNLGQNGVALTNADLDECHGHTHAITVNGVSVNQYHYHATKEFPYTVGCFRGTPVQVR